MRFCRDVPRKLPPRRRFDSTSPQNKEKELEWIKKGLNYISRDVKCYLY
jgi:hypothetical protein